MRFKVCCFLFFICAGVKAIPAGLLYDFEVPEARQLIAEDDVSSDEINLQVPIAFYGMTYKSIYVSSQPYKLLFCIKNNFNKASKIICTPLYNCVKRFKHVYNDISIFSGLNSEINRFFFYPS